VIVVNNNQYLTYQEDKQRTLF